jgi:hypothetical protein
MSATATGKNTRVPAARLITVALVVILVGLGAWAYLAGGRIVRVSPDHQHTTTLP